jgi:hypothetical protein
MRSILGASGQRLCAVALVTIVAVMAASPSAAQNVTGKRGLEVPKEATEADLELKRDSPLGADELAAAGTIEPVPAEVLKALLPASLKGLERASYDGSTYFNGPAGMTSVYAEYRDAERALRVDLVDPAGFPPLGPFYLEILDEGVSRQRGLETLTGLKLGEYPAAVRVRQGSSERVLQVLLGPRVRLTLKSEQLSEQELLNAAGDFDLDTIAGLAPEPAPPKAQKQR